MNQDSAGATRGHGANGGARPGDQLGGHPSDPTGGQGVGTTVLGTHVSVREMGIAEEREGSGGWFHKMVAGYLRRSLAGRKAKRAVRASDADQNATERAHRAIRIACAKSVATGLTAGSVSTVATLLTAETQGLAGIVTIPMAAATIGGELVFRSIVHLDLVLDLADIFGVDFDSHEDRDLWRLYALAFGAKDHGDDESDPGRELVHEVSHVEGEQVSEKLGAKFLGESVARNLLPVVGIVTSALTNYLVTRRLGDTVRRYMRYQRALRDAFAQVDVDCKQHLDLLVEGLWFIFTADGRLSPEEAGVLTSFLLRLDPVTRRAVSKRFVEDELDWTDRLRDIPEAMRDAFFRALEVAAAVDKDVGLPERRLLRHAARALGREFDMKRLQGMIEEFEEKGVLDH